MSLPIIFMFSGQGSQYYHMGEGLFKENAIFREAMLKTDRIYRDKVGFSLIEDLYAQEHSKSDPCVRTLITHPAIFMLEYALMQILFENHIQPDFVLGYSMGEFTAAVVAGALSLEAAMQAVIIQAQLFEQYCQTGSMLAILHDSSLFHTEAYLHEFSELAAINFATHFVITGTLENLNLIKDRLDKENITSQFLPVSYPFHSSLMSPVQRPFLRSIQGMQIKKPMIPMLSCTSAGFLDLLSPEHFWDIIHLPVLFQKTINNFESQRSGIYLDLGPSGTLATFVKYNLLATSLSKQYVLLSPYGDDVKNLKQTLAQLKM